MSQDVRLTKPIDGLYDLVTLNSTLETVDGLETAILISLLTDVRAPSSAVQTPSNRRGWVGNILTVASGRQLGSRLWLYEQSRLTPAILNDVKIAAEESLAWMVEDGVARLVTAEVLSNGKRDTTIEILIVNDKGREKRYSILWRRTGEL